MHLCNWGFLEKFQLVLWNSRFLICLLCCKNDIIAVEYYQNKWFKNLKPVQKYTGHKLSFAYFANSKVFPH